MSNKENQPVPTERAKWVRVFFNLLSILVLIAIIAYGIIVYFHLNRKVYTDDAQVEQYINPINVRIQGYIESIRFEENQAVKKGDTLVIIDDREYKIQVEQALANLEDVKAGKNVVQSDVNVAANSTNISDANIAEMKARLDNQATNLKRYANLLKSDVVSQFQYDEIKTEYDAMKAKYESLTSQKYATQLTTKSVSSKIAVSNAAIMHAQAAVDLAKLNLSYCYIIAPYNGVMGRRKIDVGQLMTPGQPLVTIVQSGDIWVIANYTENQIARIKVGDLLKLKIDAVPNTYYEGRVQSLSGATGSSYSAVPVDNSTGNFVKVQQRIPVKIVFTDKNKPEDMKNVRAGMNVEIVDK